MRAALGSKLRVPFAGERGRDGGPFGVLIPEPKVEAVPCFFCFLREDSFPLASEASCDPGRFRPDFRPDGVLVPLEEAPDGAWPAFFLSSPSFFV